MAEETTTETTPKKTTRAAKSTAPAIYKALQKVMEGIANVPKNGQMSFGKTNYTYLRADDVQEKLNPLLRENNVIVQPFYEIETVKRGREPGVDYVYVALHMKYISSEDGSELETGPFYGEAQASDDKSINKALTQALKNANRIIFQFASGEPEPDDINPGASGSSHGIPAQPQRPAEARAVRQQRTSDQGGAQDENTKLKSAIRAWIGGDDTRRSEVNAAQEALKLEGAKGVDVNRGIVTRLEIPVE